MSDESGGNFILDPRTLAAKILDWKQKGFHVLSPAINMTSFAPGYGVNASLVLLDPTIDDRGRGLDVYFDKNTLKDHERGLSKIGLGRIAAAAGVSWLAPPHSGRRDHGPGLIQNYWIYQVTGVYLAYDGTPQTIHGEKEIDYRDGSAQIGGWSPAAWREALAEKKTNINGWSERRVMQARGNGAERAETGAMERAIRMGFGVKHAYTVAELKQPFVALRVCPMVDMADPSIRAMVTERQLGGVAALFGHVATSSPRGLPAKPETIDIAPVRREPESAPVVVGPPPVAADVQNTTMPPGQVARPEAAPRAPEQAPPPQDRRQQPRGEPAAEPLPEGAFYIKACTSERKPYRQPRVKNGQTVTHFTKWTVVSDTGEQATTVYPQWGQLADECFKAGDAVTWTLGESSSYGEREILNLARASVTASL
jgi:hypothetical protein